MRTTVRDMIAALEKLPPDAPLFMSGYEGGYLDAGLPTANDQVVMVLDFRSLSVYGPHEEINRCRWYTQHYPEKSIDGKEQVRGYIIPGHDP